ncbi:MAG: hypothetical protein QM731_04740 [Chitinophagaceae bacterium]
MTENTMISKAAPPFESMDFAALRKAGISYFEKMGSKLWTDYNLHDPGITILEVLCYAITDLGFRTNFPIQDILASGEPSNAKQFFSALEILTCNPVTPNDFRKILIDLNGIKNAWLLKTAKQEMNIGAVQDGQDENGNPKWTLKYNDTTNPVVLNGLYDVYIDFEDDVDQDDLERVHAITQAAWKQLWKHRSLCEDFVKVDIIRETILGIDAELELCPGADVNIVAGEIYYQLQEFLTPTVQFYSFTEMHDAKNRDCDEIFDGPVLCNGFIDNAELDNAQLRKEVYVSDLWQVIMSVCGVASIRKLTIKSFDDKENIVTTTSDSKWCIKIDDFHKPVLNRKLSTIYFQQNFDCIYPDDRKVQERIALQKKLNEPRKKSNQPPALEAGINRELEEYFSIQDEFPFTYKIAEGQIIDVDTQLRKAQVKQLKGYLMLFDEMLANYLALLGRAKDLLSVNQPTEHTFFYSTLYGISGVKDLIKAYPEEEDQQWDSFTANDDNGYVHRLKEIIETETRRKQRKNIFLDHLLARFGESFTEYVLQQFQEQCDCSSSVEGDSVDSLVLQYKAAFLKRIPELSSERGKGFNYKALDCSKPDVWDSANVAGLKKRVCMYLGFSDFNRKTLTCAPEFDIVAYRLIADGKVQSYRLRLQDKHGTILLDGIKSYRLQQNTQKDIKDLREQILRHVVDASDPSKGTVIVPAADVNGYSRVIVKDRENNSALQSDMVKYDDAIKLRDKVLLLAFPESCATEGFHVVEHILLRPKDDDYLPMFDPVNINAPNAGPSYMLNDPYSFWITIAVPEWLPRFKNNPNAQYQFEQLVRREAPAHVLVKFCWMDPHEMYDFESAYLQWLYEQALEEPNERELTNHVNDLVTLMKKCTFKLRETGDPCLAAKQQRVSMDKK